jgi:hypothetical protein
MPKPDKPKGKKDESKDKKTTDEKKDTSKSAKVFLNKLRNTCIKRILENFAI